MKKIGPKEFIVLMTVSAIGQGIGRLIAEIITKLVRWCKKVLGAGEGK